MPSVFIKTYGCQMNERDSEAVAAQLVAKGYSLAKSEALADVVLLNTCSVRDMAEQKALNKMANLIGSAKKERPNQIFGFMGCMAQSRGQELVDKLPDVDLVVGTQKFHRTADYLDEILAGRRDKIVDTAAEEKSEAAIREHLLNGNAQKSISAFVSIMQGCNQYCTFCIVPYTRGEERSRTIPDIVAECRELVSRGVREITLLGQIVTSYGKSEKREEWRLNGASASPSTRDPRPPTRLSPLFSCWKPSTKSTASNASASPHRIPKVTAMTSSKPTGACRNCVKARTFPSKAEAIAC